MRAALKSALKSAISGTPAYPLVKEVYRHTLNRRYLRARRQLMDFYRPFAFRVAFDVGANRGDFADAFLRLGAKVYAMEPHPTCIAEMDALYGTLPTFTLIPCALGATPGEAQLYLGEHGMDNVSTLSEEFRRDGLKHPGLAKAGWSKSIRVPVDTLDRLMERYEVPDFCKIDVEGYEIEVLHGLTRQLPLIQFEYQPWSTEKAVECVDYLMALGKWEFNITMSEDREDKVSLFKDWLTPQELLKLLRTTVMESQCLGDVFARSLGETRAV